MWKEKKLNRNWLHVHQAAGVRSKNFINSSFNKQTCNMEHDGRLYTPEKKKTVNKGWKSGGKTPEKHVKEWRNSVAFKSSKKW